MNIKEPSCLMIQRGFNQSKSILCKELLWCSSLQSRTDPLPPLSQHLMALKEKTFKNIGENNGKMLVTKIFSFSTMFYT